MADILLLSPRPIRSGRPRNRPIEGAPLAPVIGGVVFRHPTKPTYAEVTATIDRITYHLLEAGRKVTDLSEACRAYHD